MLASCMKDEEKLTEVFRTGNSFEWHEHEKELFEGCERFFRPGYLANLTTSWIPALNGVHEKLQHGAKVAVSDVAMALGAVEVQNFTAIMSNQKQAVQNAKVGLDHRQEVHSGEDVPVIR